MRAISQHRQQPQASKPLRALLATGLAGIVLMVGLVLLMNIDTVTEREHAVIKHGIEAEQIRECLNNGGQQSLWKSRSWKRPNTYIQCGQLPDGRWGIRFLEKLSDGRWLEKTSFIVKNGTLAELTEYITARAIKIK